MGTILAVDPGTYSSGVVILAGDGRVLHTDAEKSSRGMGEALVALAVEHAVDLCVFERILSYGMRVGVTTFDTCMVIGAAAKALQLAGFPVWLVPRKAVTAQLCGKANAKDPDVAAACREVYIVRGRDLGSGSSPAVGLAKSPGPLFGVKSHAWQALGLALAVREKPALLDTPAGEIF